MLLCHHAPNLGKIGGPKAKLINTYPFTMKFCNQVWFDTTTPLEQAKFNDFKIWAGYDVTFNQILGKFEPKSSNH